MSREIATREVVTDKNKTYYFFLRKYSNKKVISHITTIKTQNIAGDS